MNNFGIIIKWKVIMNRQQVWVLIIRVIILMNEDSMDILQMDNFHRKGNVKKYSNILYD